MSEEYQKIRERLLKLSDDEFYNILEQSYYIGVTYVIPPSYEIKEVMELDKQIFLIDEIDEDTEKIMLPFWKTFIRVLDNSNKTKSEIPLNRNDLIQEVLQRQKDLGISSKNLCRLCGISISTFYNFKQGKNIKQNTLEKILNFVGIDLCGNELKTIKELKIQRVEKIIEYNYISRYGYCDEIAQEDIDDELLKFADIIWEVNP